MILRILIIFGFIFFRNNVKGQSPEWYLQATIGAEFSHYKSPFNIKDTFPEFNGTDRLSGFNYQLGGIIGHQLNPFFSFESGLHLLIREDKNIDRTITCGLDEFSENCFSLSPSIQKKRYHIFEIPIRIRLQKNLSEKKKVYLAGAYSNYLYYATIYDSGSFEGISNRIYYAFSFNTNIGLEYQLHPKWLIGLDINARVFERRQRDEIRFMYGQEEKNYYANFDNVNIGIFFKYQIF